MMIYLIVVISSCIGSFLYCINTNNISSRRSKCDHCDHILGALDLIPIVSYIYLKGRCRYCHAKIKFDHLFWELISVILYCLIYLQKGINKDTYLLYVMTFIFISLSIKDYYYLYIPDYYHLILIILRLLTLNNYYEIKSCLLSGLFISLTLLVISIFTSRLMHEEVMGFGDIKLFFALGLYFNYYSNLIILLLSAIMGLIYCLLLKKYDKFAYGPLICLSYYVFLLIK